MASMLHPVASVPPARTSTVDSRHEHVSAQASVVSLQPTCSYGRSSLRWSDCISSRLPTSCSRVSVADSRRQERGILCMVLPTGNPEAAAASNLHPWEARAVKGFSMAELEARKLKYPTTGTEALLMGIMTEGAGSQSADFRKSWGQFVMGKKALLDLRVRSGNQDRMARVVRRLLPLTWTSEAARFLRRNGVTLFGVKDEIIKLLGKADMYFFSPEHPPLTRSAQKALDWAIDEKNRVDGDNGKELSTTMMVLGIWAQKKSDGQKVLEALGINDDKIMELAATLKRPAAATKRYEALVQ